MSFCEKEGDVALIKDIFEKLSDFDKENIIISKYTDIDEALYILGSSKKIVAMRYHAMILAWLLEKEVSVISYSKKTIDVINDLFPEQKYTNIAEFNGRGVEFSKLDDKRLKKYINESSRQFMYVDRWLNMKEKNK